MNNAKGGEKHDFKINGPNGEVNWMKVNVARSDQAASLIGQVLFIGLMA